MSPIMIVVLTLLLIITGQSAAYSFQAHFLIANCAWHLLEEDTKANIEELLEQDRLYYDSLITRPCTEECTPLGEFAKWADDVRDDDEAFKVFSDSELGHYVEVPDDEISCPLLHEDDDANSTCSLDYDRDCPNNLCILGAIPTHTRNLLALHNAEEARRLGSRNSAKESLMFLAHFFGDVHCPLHVDRRTDYGGTWIKVTWIDQDHYFYKQRHWIVSNFLCHLQIISGFLGSLCTGKPMHLHKVWDKMIVEKAIDEQYGGSRNAMEQDLLKYIEDTPTEVKESWLSCPDGSQQECVMEWGNESLEAALRYAYIDVDGNEVVNGTILTEAYYERGWTITKELMCKSILRMASTLSLCF